jgi:hypothetical protein
MELDDKAENQAAIETFKMKKSLRDYNLLKCNIIYYL